MSREGLPEAFVRGILERLGSAEAEAFLATYDEPAERGIRLNPLKPGDGVRTEDVGEAVPWAQDAYYLAADSRAGAGVLHEAGAFYLQDPAAMLPAAVLDARPGETVLDLCAAPGGKSTQLACAMAGRGLLVCNEPVPKRAAVLSRNLERMGVPNALAVSAWPDELAERWPGGFDAVLADAPCSGEGMFRRDPETRAQWSPEESAGCAVRQLRILDAAARLVRPGGRLVYSTCTFSPEENERNVERFLAAHPDFALIPWSRAGIGPTDGTYTCWPHRLRGEGQFTALMRKAGNAPASLPEDRSLPKPDRSLLRAFADTAGVQAPVPNALLGDTAIFLPGLPDVRGLKVLRAGVHLCRRKGRVLEPDHAWAVSAATPAWDRVDLTEEQSVRWLAGETVPAPEGMKGWVLPCRHGLPLGFGKASCGTVKNHYPKGLRRAVTPME